MFMAWGRRRRSCVIQLWLHASTGQLFEWWCRKFEVNNFCTVSILGYSKSQLSTGWEKPRSPQGWWLPSKNADLNSSGGRPIHLIWHPHTTTSSSKWRKSLLVATVTVMMILSLLWATFWRSKTLASKKKGSICSTAAALSKRRRGPCCASLSEIGSVWGRRLINHPPYLYPYTLTHLIIKVPYHK